MEIKNLSFLGFDNYSITSVGTVWSHSRHKYMELDSDGGYIRVGMWKDGKKCRRLVHRLVALAFIENPCNKKTVNHIDGNKSNNRVSNLEWMTHSENAKHAIDSGLKPYQFYRRDRKLPDEFVHKVCCMFQSGWRPIEIARLLDVDRHVVKNIKSGTQYLDIIIQYPDDVFSMWESNTSHIKRLRVGELRNAGIPMDAIMKALNVDKNFYDKYKRVNITQTTIETTYIQYGRE